MERGPAILVAIVDPRARVEQQDCRVAMAAISGVVQWRQGCTAQVDVGAVFEKFSYGRTPAFKRRIIKARRSVRRMLDAHATTFVGCHSNKRVKVATRSVKAHILVDERALSSVHRADGLLRGNVDLHLTLVPQHVMAVAVRRSQAAHSMAARNET